MAENLKDRLMSARAARGWSQNQLAEVSGVAAQQVSRYEAGRSEPRPQVAAKLAGALQVPLEWLLDGRGRSGIGSIDSSEKDVKEHLSVFLSPDLMELLRLAAQSNERSLAEEVSTRLRASLDMSNPRALSPSELSRVIDRGLRDLNLLTDVLNEYRESMATSGSDLSKSTRKPKP